METKAGYVAVGLAAMLALALFLGFLLFAMKMNIAADLALYRIEFEDGVSGLSVGNEVRFHGLRVGEVRRIELNPQDPSLVRVIIAIDSTVPVHADCEASVEAVGITGLSVVYLSGGSPSSPLLLPDQGEDLPRIKSKESSLRSVFQKTPEILDSAQILLRRGGELLSAENEENLRRLIASLAEISSGLEQESRDLRGSLARFQVVLEKMDTLLTGDLPSAINVFRNSFQRFNEVLDQAEPGLRRFSSLMADDVHRLLNEGNLLMHNLNALVQRINADPQRFFFGDAVPGYKMK
ncbi:MAG: MlaD family protein [Desulfovibrionaceae bacterium]|nr:MlaD family protein [Desulfovibrionaceae bacterium]